MISKNFYYQLITRILGIVVTAIVMAFFFLKEYNALGIVAAIALIIQTSLLIQFTNNTNRKIAHFFNSIKNEDFTLRFPENLDIKSLRELNSSLNMLNSMIQKVYLKNEAQEKYYQEIIKQANIGILTLNKKGHILFVNPMMENLLNYKPLNHINQLAQVSEELHRFFSNIEPFENKLFQFSNEREKVQLSIKSTSVMLNKEELLLVVAQDIHKELDKNETDSWIRLIKVLTHEIMNTITPITSISASISKFFKVGDSIKPINELTENQIKSTSKGLDVIKEQGENLMDFVQSYRTFLSVPNPDKEPISALKLLDNARLLLENSNTNITIKTIVKPFDLEIFADEKLINQVLINLIKNAFQALENRDTGGVITLLAGINENHTKYIQVIDNGSGISEEVMSEIFIPFFTTKNKGSGIGLSLSKHIMRLHGGSIIVVSNDIETKFTLLF
ncbi:ATP-binding protein [uncultured Maribacter sp.]|uniref:sensor histidine kinase n=1 Tax=uncultured Maribacter sp. TaxID=431308 RepID=UPI002626E978|nr:ATP-binding protein [uncultured Maribacter sp.]